MSALRRQYSSSSTLRCTIISSCALIIRCSPAQQLLQTRSVWLLLLVSQRTGLVAISLWNLQFSFFSALPPMITTLSTSYSRFFWGVHARFLCETFLQNACQTRLEQTASFSCRHVYQSGFLNHSFIRRYLRRTASPGAGAMALIVSA